MNQGNKERMIEYYEKGKLQKKETLIKLTKN